MPLNRNQLIRINTIDCCLQNKFRDWTLEDLIEACSDALYEFEGITSGVSRRTIQSDIQLMRSEKLGYNAPIEVADKKYYIYSNKDYSITKVPLSQEDVRSLSQAIDVLKHFSAFSQFNPVSGIINRLEDYIQVTISHEIPIIHLETNENLKGLEFVTTLYQHIIEKNCISIDYQSFKSEKPKKYTVSPYLLKEFKNRWFLLGYEKRQKNQTLALDRIIKIERNKEDTYIPNTFFDIETYFDDLIGVTKNITSKPEKVVLWVDNDQAPYVLTKPMHKSQTIIERQEKGIIISINVCMNLELEREIISFGEHIKVMSPRLLKHRIHTKLRLAVENYKMES